MNKPPVLLLAAGVSTRFGADKRRHCFKDGRRLMDRMLDTIAEAGLPVLVVLRPGDPFESELTVPTCVALHASQGMGSTIADAVGQLPPDLPGCLILPVDLPLLKPATLMAVAKHLRPRGIVQPVCESRVGHPVAFAREFFHELSTLEGDVGARSVIRKYSASVNQLPVDDKGIYQDMDTPEFLDLLDL